MAVSGVGSSSTAATGNKFAELSSEEFVRIMTAELTRQDPLKPNDSSKILEQMSSLRQIESSTNLSNKLDALVSQNEFSSAGNLLGATVSGISELGTRQTGIAISIVRTSKGPAIELESGHRLLVRNIDTVDLTLVPEQENPAPTTPTPPPSLPTAVTNPLNAGMVGATASPVPPGEQSLRTGAGVMVGAM